MNCFLFTDLMPEIAGEAAEWRRNVPLGSDGPGPHPSIGSRATRVPGVRACTCARWRHLLPQSGYEIPRDT